MTLNTFTFYFCLDYKQNDLEKDECRSATPANQAVQLNLRPQDQRPRIGLLLRFGNQVVNTTIPRIVVVLPTSREQADWGLGEKRLGSDVAEIRAASESSNLSSQLK
jgi:hypothetical protein